MPGNSQTLLGMPDTAALNIINLNIASIQAEIASCKTNREQEMYAVAEGCTNTDAGAINKQDTNSQNVQNNSHNSINYFFSSSNIMADKRQSLRMTQGIHNRFGNIFNGIGCFEGMFSLQLKPNSKPYQAPPRCVAYALQKPFNEELECLQKMDLLTPLGVDETLEWCNSFVLVPKANGKVRLVWTQCDSIRH